MVGEFDVEVSKIDLSLLAGWRLEANFEARSARWAQVANTIPDSAVAAVIAAFPEFAPQPHRRKARIRGQAFPQIGLERIDNPGPRRPRFVGRWREPLGDIGTNRLAIDAELPSNGGDRQALPVQIQNHHEFPEFDHQPPPPAEESSIGETIRCPAFPGAPWNAGHHQNWGIFKCHNWGELIRR